MKHNILYKLIAMFTIVILLSFANFNTSKAITMNAYPMESTNFNIWGESVQTTFNDKGYETVLSVNGSETKITNCSGSLNGVSVVTKLTYISNGNYVKISYEATNTSGSAKTIGIATYADIQIADNDYAPITNLSGNRGFTMTDGTKYTFTFLGRNSYGVTDVDTYWFGQYQIREENKWNNSQTFDYGNTTDRQGDSGMAFSWKNRTIQNGEKLTFSTVIGVGTLNTPPTIRVTSQLKNSYFQGEVVDVQGYVNDADNGDIVTVKYAIDNGEEITIANNLVPNRSEKYFHTSFTIPNNISNGRHFFQVWAADNCGNMSVPVTVYFNVNKDVTAPTGTHSINPSNWTNGNVTISLSTKDDMSGVKRIKKPDGNYVSSSSTTYTVSQNGTYTFVLEDNVGNTRNYNVQITNIDKTAPTGTLTHNPTDWVIDIVTIHWTASDSQSGFNRVVLPDGSTSTNDSGDFTVTENGSYSFTLYDNVGNSRILTENINNIDKIMPEGVLSLEENKLTDKQIKITWQAFDLQSGFAKILLPDSTISTSATGEFTVSQMGVYSFIIYDKVGNTKKLDIEVNNVDMNNPTLSVTQDTNKWTNGEITLNWKANDSQSGLESVILPNSEIKTENQGDYVVNENGDYIFLAYDKIGNGVLVKHTVSNIDKIYPNLELSAIPADDGGIKISWEASDEQSGFSNVTLPDGKRIQSSTGSVEIYEDGVYSFIAYDNAGNGTIKNVTISGMNTGCEIEFTLNKEAIDATHWKINWQVTKGENQFSYIVLPNGTFSYEKEGSHIVTGGDAEYTFLAYDKKGNQTKGTIAVSY